MHRGYAFYRAVTGMAEPGFPLLVRWRARGEDAALRDERLGRAPAEPVEVWWHAASLGEVAALRPVHALAHRRRGFPDVVTTSTAAGRRAAASFADAASLVPLDGPRAMRRVVAARRPAALVLVETELWPNLLVEAPRGGARLALVNGRISDRAWPRYRKLAGFMRSLLCRMEAVAARSERDAERLLCLGVPAAALRVAGNTKLDGPGAAAPARLPWDEGPVWTAASVHPGEADVLLAAFAALRARFRDLRLVLAPRHLEEPARWVDRLERAGWRVARRSAAAAEDGDSDVLLLDTHGELRSVLAASAVAYLGGTLVPVGGHNPMEAAVAAVPQVFGPGTANAAEECRALEAAGAARTVVDAATLEAALTAWLADDALRRRDGGAGLALVAASRGAAERAVGWLEERGVLRVPA